MKCVPGGDNLVKDVQFYELFGGIAHKNHTFSFLFIFKGHGCVKGHGCAKGNGSAKDHGCAKGHCCHSLLYDLSVLTILTKLTFAPAFLMRQCEHDTR